MSRAARVSDAQDGMRARAYDVAAAVLDPELPCVTVAELGILRSVEVIQGVCVVKVTPTYLGCPAITVIEAAIDTALTSAGLKCRVQRVLAPAWTTDWITERGREKLRAFGIAPPLPRTGDEDELFRRERVACPRCDSQHVERLSAFGATACKAQYRCVACAEPFEYFKCL